MLQIEKSALAKEDLINIWLYGLEHYGETQADFYFDRLEIKINSLAEHPEKYQVRNQYTPPVRICPHKSHIVIYTIDNGVRVLGEKMKIEQPI